MKKFISSILAGCMLFAAIPAMAGDINITIDGEKFIPKNALGEEVFPFIENGSTLLPVRAMGEAVGKEVSFDAENYAVYIGTRPMETEVKKEPVMLVGDKIFCEDVIGVLGIETVKNGEKLAKMARSMATEAEINEKLAAKSEMIENTVLEYGEEKRAAVEYLAYYEIYSDIILENEELKKSVYGDFVTVKHILVTDEALAKEIVEKIDGGTAFEDLIEEYNTDPGQTKDSSYTFTYGEMVEEFEKAAFELGENEYTKEPVKSNFGYHIIKKLPLDGEGISQQSYALALEKKIEEVELERVVLVNKKGDYGKIEGVIYTTDMLDEINEMFTGEKNAELYSDAFEYALMMNIINNIAREKGLVKDDGDEDFDLESEKALFLGLYQLLFDGSFIIEDEEFENAYNEAEYEAFKSIKVFVDGKLIIPCDVNNNYVEPKNVDGTVYVPVRAITQALGMKADWDNDTRTVVIEK